MSGKHTLGLVAITAFPGFMHLQPKAFIAGQKGCNGCHNLGITDKHVRNNKLRKYYKYGMDCQSCHTRHAFSVKEAKRLKHAIAVILGLTMPNGSSGTIQNMDLHISWTESSIGDQPVKIVTCQEETIRL